MRLRGPSRRRTRVDARMKRQSLRCSVTGKPRSGAFAMKTKWPSRPLPRPRRFCCLSHVKFGMARSLCFASPTRKRWSCR